MKRLSILIVAILVGAAAPARAWCEATCLAPVASESAKPHCPTHEPAPDGSPILTTADADCPSIESARPASVKIEFVRAAAAHAWQAAPRRVNPSAAAPSRPTTTIHHINRPLRI